MEPDDTRADDFGVVFLTDVAAAAGLGLEAVERRFMPGLLGGGAAGAERRVTRGLAGVAAAEPDPRGVVER